MLLTTNYNLNKPELTDTVGTTIPALSTSMDTIDALFTKPRCRAYHNIVTSIPNGAWTAMAFNSERYNVGSIHSTTVNNSRITFSKAGFYSGGANVAWTADARGERGLGIRLNGSTVINRVVDSADTVGAHDQQVNFEYTFASGDYIEVIVFQSTTVSLNLNYEGNYSPEFYAKWEA